MAAREPLPAPRRRITMRASVVVIGALLGAGLSGCGPDAGAPNDPASAAPETVPPTVSPTTSGAPPGLPASAVRLDLPTQDAPLWMTREKDPRGGFQIHVHTAEGEEILADGQPLVPFLATDVSEAPTAATCTEDGEIRVLAARTHKPPGIVVAWDLFETVYTLEGETATGETAEVRNNVLDDRLRRAKPELFALEMFENCRA